MVQFLSINFFYWISSIFVGFFKGSRFLCHSVYLHLTPAPCFKTFKAILIYSPKYTNYLRDLRIIQSFKLKSGAYFNISNLFTKIYNMLYYTTNLYLQQVLEMMSIHFNALIDPFHHVPRNFS